MCLRSLLEKFKFEFSLFKLVRRLFTIPEALNVLCREISWYLVAQLPLQWRHNEPYGVLNHRYFDCLLKSLFRRTSK